MIKEGSHLWLKAHIIQPYPPNSANRDLVGSVKTAHYGESMRGMQSSQSVKHSMKTNPELGLPSELSENERSFLTKKCPEMVAEQILILRPELKEKEAKDMAEYVLTEAGIPISKGRTKALFYLSVPQAKALAELAVNGEKDSKKYKKALTDNSSIEQTFFGAMLAGNSDLTTDGCAYFSPTLSVGKTKIDFNDYIAKDELSNGSEAAMMGTEEFFSMEGYRSMSCAIHCLAEDAGDMSGFYSKQLLKSFVYAEPRGREHAYDHFTFPDMIAVELWPYRGMNLYPAFGKPVRDEGMGLAGPTIQRLGEYAENRYELYGFHPIASFVVCGGEFEAPKVFGEQMNLTDMLDAVEERINQWVRENTV